MDDEVRALLRHLDGPPGLDRETAEQTVRELGLPGEYAAFLEEHDGAEGFIGESYVRLVGRSGFAEEAASPPLEYLSGLVVFGTNGAGEAFVADSAGEAAVLPWIGARSDGIPQGRFDEFVRRLRDNRVFERD